MRPDGQGRREDKRMNIRKVKLNTKYIDNFLYKNGITQEEFSMMVGRELGWYRHYKAEPWEMSKIFAGYIAQVMCMDGELMMMEEKKKDETAQEAPKIVRIAQAEQGGTVEERLKRIERKLDKLISWLE